MTTYASRHNTRVWTENQHRDEVSISEFQIERDCAVCFRGRERIVPEHEVMLFSLNGVVHEGADLGMTVCGKDATGFGWWWRM